MYIPLGVQPQPPADDGHRTSTTSEGRPRWFYVGVLLLRLCRPMRVCLCVSRPFDGERECVCVYGTDILRPRTAEWWRWINTHPRRRRQGYAVSLWRDDARAGVTGTVVSPDLGLGDVVRAVVSLLDLLVDRWTAGQSGGWVTCRLVEKGSIYRGRGGRVLVGWIVVQRIFSGRMICYGVWWFASSIALRQYRVALCGLPVVEHTTSNFTLF
jgi:hypothetical protein